MHADQYYLFRHAIMRDAAYILHTPALRGTLHRVALELMEAHHKPELPPPGHNLSTEPQPFDAEAMEFARHARFAQQEPYANAESLRSREADYLIRAANHAMRDYDHEEALSAWRRLSEVAAGRVQFWALHRVSGISRALGRNEEALKMSRRSLALAQAELTEQLQAIALSELGLLHWHMRQPDVASKYLEESAAIAGEKNENIMANTIGLLAMVLEQTGKMEEAETQYLRALELLRKLGDRINEGVFLQNLAGLYIEQDRNEEGESHLRKAVDILTELDAHTDLGIAYNNLSILESERGEYAKAIQYAEQAMKLHRRVGNRRSLGVAFHNRGLSNRRLRTHEKAASDFSEALAIHREVGNRGMEGKTLIAYAIQLVAEGKQEPARRNWILGASILGDVLGAHAVEKERQQMSDACTKAGMEPFD